MRRPLTALRKYLVVLAAVAAWRSSSAQVADDAPVLTADQAVQLAIDSNRPLKVVSLDIDKSKWQVTSAKTRRLPTFKTYFFASGNLNSPSFTFKENTFGNVNGFPVPAKDTEVPLSHGVTGSALAEIAQPISQLYKINLGIREQMLGVDLANQDYRAQRQSLVSDVKQAYYAVLQTESALSAARATVTQFVETERVASQYVAQQELLEAEHLDVKAKLSQAKFQVIKLNNQLQSRKARLNGMLARDLATPFRTQDVSTQTKEEIDLKAARQTALANRPEIAKAEISIKKAGYDKRLAKADYIPDIGAALHYFSPLNTEILPRHIVSAGVEFSWEPFEWGRRRDDLKQKEIALDQSNLQLQEVQSQVLQDVDNRFRDLEESRVLLDVTETARAAANERLREISDKFSKEAVLLRDVLQQQSAVASANNDYEQALLSFWTAKANFEKALGEE